MLIAKLNSNNVVIEVGDHTEIFPNVSFPESGVDINFLIDNSAREVIQFVEYDLKTEKFISVEPYFKDNYVYSFKIELKTEDELAIDYDKLYNAQSIITRNERDQLLKDSDWTQISDAPTNKEAWIIYRQELRDVTLQEGFPFNIVWPEKPTI